MFWQIQRNYLVPYLASLQITDKKTDKKVEMSTEKIVVTNESDENLNGAKLERVFGVVDATAHIIGGIIGSGIFISPKVNRHGE